MTKKIVVLLLMLVVIFTFTGCVFNSVNTVNRSDQIVNTYEVTDEAVVRARLGKSAENGEGNQRRANTSYVYDAEPRPLSIGTHG